MLFGIEMAILDRRRHQIYLQVAALPLSGFFVKALSRKRVRGYLQLKKPCCYPRDHARIWRKYDFWTPPDHDGFFARIRKALKPGGVLIVIDHVALPGTGNSAPQQIHRIDEAFAKRDIESTGFRFQAASDALRNPGDDHTILAYDEAIRGHTDRFIYRFIQR
jgi:SAM-dependent methyltransferase